jgi:hypothetical protein
MRMLLLVLSAILTSPALAMSDQKLPPDRAPSLMTSKEIRAYNAGLDMAHPYYIRCRKDAVVGSLVRKLRVCRTNEEWKRFAAQGENNGREILDEMSHAPINQGAPDACAAHRC